MGISSNPSPPLVPIVGAITAANLWGWLPSLLWLLVGVSFIGWVQDYSAMMMAVRKDGDSLTAISHKLISPRTRTIFLLFIFVYLLMIVGAFGNMLAGTLNTPTERAARHRRPGSGGYVRRSDALQVEDGLDRHDHHRSGSDAAGRF